MKTAEIGVETKIRAFLLPAAMLIASEFCYLLLLRLDAINGVRPVLSFLAIMGAAFTLCFGAYRLLIKRRWGSAEWT